MSPTDIEQPSRGAQALVEGHEGSICVPPPDGAEGHPKPLPDPTETSATDKQDKDSPDALVRKENQAVLIVRVIILLVLALAAVGTSTFVYIFTHQAEEDAFESEFDAMAERILATFMSETNLRMYQARTVAGAVSMDMGSQNTTIYELTIDPSSWDQVTQETRFLGRNPVVAYSPFIRNDEDRKTFEQHAAAAGGLGTNPLCTFCDPGVKFANRHDLIDLPGYGTYTCESILDAGLSGTVPADLCPLLQVLLSSACTCDSEPTSSDFVGWPVQDGIFRMEGEAGVGQDQGKAPYAPLWQTLNALIDEPPNMYDQMSEPRRAEAIRQALDGPTVVFSSIIARAGVSFYESYGGLPEGYTIHVYYPIFDPNTSQAVGVVLIEVFLSEYITSALPVKSNLTDIVIENSCGQAVTTQPNKEGTKLHSGLMGDLHDRHYTHLGRGTTFDDFEDSISSATTGLHTKSQDDLEYCRYRFVIYPRKELEEEYVTNKPLYYAFVTGGIFLFTSFVFGLYDWLVRHRQSKVMKSANRTNDIVSALFPKNVRDRLYEQARAEEQASRSNAGLFGLSSGKTSKMHMQSFLTSSRRDLMLGSEPIADFFPHTTVLFFNVAGFSAWSSERDPSQVFKLLETLYQAFDEVGKQMKVFKVETIGDSYVAACGLPTPRRDHAIVMVRFAHEILRKTRHITKNLERYLGPSTGDLQARVGLHTGPVTAGVLRGEKARFQLFGETMNVALSLESTGYPGRIHISPSTADQLRAQGKSHWIEIRQGTVNIKAKGLIQTYWASPCSKNTTPSTTSDSVSYDDLSSVGDQELEFLDEDLAAARSQSQRLKDSKRLVEWNVEVLLNLLENIVRSRGGTGPGPTKARIVAGENALLHSRDGIVVDEMTQILSMPQFSEEAALQRQNTSTKIPEVVQKQLHEYVSLIAGLYRNVPFHNFDHASHVIMSAGKLMKRLITPEEVDYNQKDHVSIARDIHISTYGISSDPLMLFAVVFSALIHDVDHTGLTNAELVKMNTTASTLYRQRSVAEQNSVDIAWELLMDHRFHDLRACIYTNEEELHHFRQLLVNAVMATDIADKELQTLRKSRWTDAFDRQPEPSTGSVQPQDSMEIARKATIVFEYIIQAADVAHCMQHWQVYQKYNKRLFEERYLAWAKGVAGEKKPSEGWYKGELWFFDNYIIPTAEKLDKCGVFGVSYHEFLQYALSNRHEWEEKGEKLVEEMTTEVEAKLVKQGFLTKNESGDVVPVQTPAL